MDTTPKFERADDKFLGATKTQFALISAIFSLFATGVAVISLLVVGVRTHQATCQAVNTVNSSIRVVLGKSIAQGEQELKDPKFARFKTQIEQAIALDRYWQQKLFSEQLC